MEPKDCDKISQLCARKKKQRPTETEEERRLRLDKRNKKDRERRARKRELKVDNTNSTDTKRVKIQEILPSTLGKRIRPEESLLHYSEYQRNQLDTKNEKSKQNSKWAHCTFIPVTASFHSIMYVLVSLNISKIIAAHNCITFSPLT